MAPMHPPAPPAPATRQERLDPLDAAARRRLMAELEAENEAPLTPEEEEECRAFTAHLPDFLHPSYPFDVPPHRLAFARHVFGMFGVPGRCAKDACRRAGACVGGEGPACFRAERRDLQQLLLVTWMMIYTGFTEEEAERALRLHGNRHAEGAADAAPERRAQRRRRGRPQVTRK